MALPLVDPSSSRASLEEHQIQSMQRMAESGKTPLDPAAAKAKEKKLREACEGFEAVFVQKMWEGMRASLPKEGPMHSRDEQFWQGMYDQELGKSIASSGGIGLADMMLSQLSRNLQNASEVAANANGRTPMSIAPVPLLPASTKAAQKTGTTGATGAAGAAGTNDMYSGAATPDAPVSDPVATAQTAAQVLAGATGATGTSTAGATPTPPEILTSLNEFATQLGSVPAQPGTQGTPNPQTNATAPTNPQAGIQIPAGMNPLVAQALQQAAQQAATQAPQQ
ncbi:MAG: rod-binding protein, partial [Bilophila sp.]